MVLPVICVGGVGLFKGLPRITLGSIMQANSINVFLNVYWFELNDFCS